MVLRGLRPRVREGHLQDRDGCRREHVPEHVDGVGGDEADVRQTTNRRLLGDLGDARKVHVDPEDVGGGMEVCQRQGGVARAEAEVDHQGSAASERARRIELPDLSRDEERRCVRLQRMPQPGRHPAPRLEAARGPLGRWPTTS
jgi:hypothetical protein